MSPEQKAARPPLQAMLPALKPALIFECVGIPGLLQQVFEGAPRDAYGCGDSFAAAFTLGLGRGDPIAQAAALGAEAGARALTRVGAP